MGTPYPKRPSRSGDTCLHETTTCATRSNARRRRCGRTGPDFALAGSYALWVFGGPEPVHDVDFVVAEPDTEKAAATLEEAGFTIERTPEDWLFKACVGDDFVIDVLHRLNGVPVEAEAILAAEEFDVLAVRMRVLAPTARADREAQLAQRAPLRLRVVGARASVRSANSSTGTACDRDRGQRIRGGVPVPRRSARAQRVTGFTCAPA